MYFIEDHLMFDNVSVSATLWFVTKLSLYVQPSSEEDFEKKTKTVIDIQPSPSHSPLPTSTNGYLLSLLL